MMAPARDALPGLRIKSVMRTGRRQGGGRVVLYVLPGSERVAAAFVAGRRVGGAVERNRARRVLREAWRALAPTVHRGADVVFVAKRGILQARSSELETEMRELLSRSGLVGS
jgi:ribonuclease P protein component